MEFGLKKKLLLISILSVFTNSVRNSNLRNGLTKDCN